MMKTVKAALGLHWVRGAALAIAAFGFAWGAAAQIVENYTLKPGDVVDVTVLEDPALGRQALIRPDGKFSIPLAGTINAFGRTPEEVARTIARRLRSNFIEPPSVTVAVVTVGPGLIDPDAEPEEVEEPREIFILGEVSRPGRFSYDPEDRLTILEALTLAGGPGAFAALKRIQVREVGEDGVETLRTFDYEAILEGGAADLTELADGAIILVPERGFLE